MRRTKKTDPVPEPSPQERGDGGNASEQPAAPAKRRRRSTKAVVQLAAEQPTAEAVAPERATGTRRRRVTVPDDAPEIPGVVEASLHHVRTSEEKPKRKKRTPGDGPAVAKREPRHRRPVRERIEAETPLEDLGPRITLEELQAQFQTEGKRVRSRRTKERWPRPIPTPSGAPRIGIVNGQPVLIIEEQVVAPHFFFGNISSEASEKAVLAEIKLAAEKGVHLFCLYLELPVDPKPDEPPAEEAVRLLDSVLAVDPDAWVMFRVVFVPSEGWVEKYPDAAYRHPDGSQADPSICSNTWWGEAEKCLKKLVTDVARRKSGKRCIGYHIERGEWFNGPDDGYDTSPAALTAFREWVRTRYFGDEVALRASWHDGSASFDTLKIPDYLPPQGIQAAILTERRERRNVDYHDFLSDAYVERVGSLARVVKEAAKGAVLVACSYGYTFEFSHPHSGHLSLARLLKCPDIDLIAGPPSYSSRLPGGACPFAGPIDSIALAGKLFILEEDYKTSLGRKGERDDFNPVLEGPKDLETAHWRGLGMALAHTCGVSWMDTWGSGWLNSPGIWSRAEKARSLFTMRLNAEPPAPDVAVLIDERSMTMLQDSRLAVNLVSKAREAVLRAGVCAGFYLLSDLTRRDFPDCSLYLFLNAWDIGAQVRAAIREKLHRNGKTLVWWYAAALLEYHRPAPETMKQVIGIALKAQPFASRPGTTITQHQHPLTSSLEGSTITTEDVYEPTYFAVDDEAEQLGVYTDTGLPSFVTRQVRLPGRSEASWRTVFLGEPFISPGLVRGLCRLAGVPIYSSAGDVVHVRPPFLTLHVAKGGRRELAVPDGYEVRDALTDEPLQDPSAELRDGETRVLLIGPPETLDHLSSLPMPAAPALAPPLQETAPGPPPSRRSKPAEPVFLLDTEEPSAESAAVATRSEGASPTFHPHGRERGKVSKPVRRRRPTKREPALAPPIEPVDEEPPVAYRFRKKT